MNPDSLFINPIANLLFRVILNTAVAWLVIMGIYFRCCKKRPFVFCLFMFNLVIFIIGFIFTNMDLGVGAGLGLFALFTMLRYRSETLNMREMTYLFVSITIGFINSARGIEHMELLILLNAMILVVVFYLEKFVGSKILVSEKIKYNNLELLKPQFRHLLIKDIFSKTGIRAKSIEIDSISLADETASLTMYYDEKENSTESKGSSRSNLAIPEIPDPLEEAAKDKSARSVLLRITK
jgi:hypothetical protein